MTKLYEIASDYAKLADSDMDPEFIQDTLDSLEGDLEVKVEQVLAIIKNEEAYAEALKAESKSLSERSKASENKVTNLKAYIASSLQTAGKKSLRAGIHQVTVRKPSVSVEVTDSNLIPVEYVEYETTIKPDKLAIKHQLEAGKVIPGATLKTGKPSLLIK